MSEFSMTQIWVVEIAQAGIYGLFSPYAAFRL
jgi:hypothetical protein